LAVTPDGAHIVILFDDTVRVLELFPAGQALVANAQQVAPRCLTADQRQAYHLPPRPPRWCDSKQKWPFDIDSVVQAHRRAGRLREAIAALENAIALDRWARDRLGSRLASVHDEIASRAFLDVALRGNPTESLKDALADAERAVALAPGNANFLDTRGQIHLALGHTDEALADLEKAMSKGFDQAHTWYARGRINELKGNREAAIADYRKAATIEPGLNEWAKHVQTQARAQLQSLSEATEAAGTSSK